MRYLKGFVLTMVCSIRYCTQDIVVYRDDLATKMRRNCIIPPIEDEAETPMSAHVRIVLLPISPPHTHTHTLTHSLALTYSLTYTYTLSLYAYNDTLDAVLTAVARQDSGGAVTPLPPAHARAPGLLAS